MKKRIDNNHIQNPFQASRDFQIWKLEFSIRFPGVKDQRGVIRNLPIKGCNHGKGVFSSQPRQIKIPSNFSKEGSSKLLAQVKLLPFKGSSLKPTCSMMALNTNVQCPWLLDLFSLSFPNNIEVSPYYTWESVFWYTLDSSARKSASFSGWASPYIV